MTVLAYLRFVLADEADRDRVSEWDEVEQVRAFEHHPEHEVIIHRWESSYAEEFEHRGFVPWIRPVVEEATA
jgi:heme-degrading monooxygenase HmoA